MNLLEVLAGGVVTPICVVLAYKRVLARSLWLNIAMFFPVAAFGVAFSIPGAPGSLELLMRVALFFAIFVALVYAGAWFEDWYHARNKDDG